MRALPLAIIWLMVQSAFGQCSARRLAGTLVIASGGREAVQRFVQLAGGPGASIVFIPTAASSLKSDSGVIWNPDDAGGAAREAFERDTLKRFGLTRLTILHTRDRHTANSQIFVASIRASQGVWLSGGNSGRLAAAYLGTRTQREFEALLAGGGVIGGESAGAIIQGSYTVRGRPDKPVLMVKSHERGFGFVANVAINPHLSA